MIRLIYGDEISSIYYLKTNSEIGLGSGALCKAQDTMNNDEYFSNSVGNKPSNLKSRLHYSKIKYTRDQTFNQQVVEFAFVLKLDSDKYDEIHRYSHLLRTFSPLDEDEIIRPFPLHLSNTLKEDLSTFKKLWRIKE